MRFFSSLLLLFASAFLALRADDAPLPTLTTARELRNLPEAEAARHYPVHLRAVVTLVEPRRTIFFRDDSGASFIRWGKNVPDLQAGDQIELEGLTYPGLYLTGIAANKVTVLAHGEPPEPRHMDYEQLASGQFHYDWVEVQGIVRSITPGEQYSVLKLALGNGSIDVYPVSDDPPPDEHLIDAVVRVAGIAAGYINDRRQLVAPHLRVRSLADVKVLEPAPAEAFAIEATPASQLLRFAPNGRAGHRVKVHGVVTQQEPGSAVYLRDGTQGLRVRTTTTETFAPADVVEALGFPTMGTLSAELDDAVLRRTGETSPVDANPAVVKDLAAGKLDADLVEVEANVRDVLREPDRIRLTVQAADTAFQAIIPITANATEIPSAGARVRLRGICRVVEATQPTRSFNTRARSFELLLSNSPGAVTILRRPPWWTTQRLEIAAGILLGLAVLALAWAGLLRRQVRRQTTLIRTQVEAVTIADERQRIAREFHDTLEQELVGVSLRLDAASTRAGDSKLHELLTSTQRLVQQLQAGVRSIVWNLRDSSLATQPLADAIRPAIANATSGRQLEILTIGQTRRLPEVIGHELLRVAQEATANAVKHGNAQRIVIRLDFSAAAQMRLVIEDDGAGFNTSAPVPAGHFGLIGIRERVEKLGGHFELRSQPGKGTTVEVQVPLPKG
ncbi:histidine kinase [Chthoniobacter flavus Ellin428]|uniref:Histidine kinase n=1 Tax=Chthoniobacter flavus Ellin428 TaxID=497964 RepID=B4CWX6_9BACT|nr:sensor histidine kinase [Chthoniobacter flavus]EDY21296.1 histidine kinase [Chthoniobacter flavus Ellin428]TCO84934.1 histidine kinase/DNA gyrase B/HSP90-like ATPase [Chthoniobacter flavus]